MSSEGEARSDRRGEPRVPFDGAVRLRYRLFQEFLQENAANISSGGMFLRTIHPGDIGSELEFEIRLDDDFTLIRGRGEVAWVRRPGGQPGAEPGMGIRFVELPDESRALVDRIVEERLAAGLELFDLESHAPAAEPASTGRPAAATTAASDDRPIWDLEAEVRAGADAAAAEADPVVEEPTAEVGVEENLAALDPELAPLASEPAPSVAVEVQPARPAPVGGAASRSSPARLVAVAVLSALVGAGAVLTFYWLYVQPSIEALETRIDELAGSPGGPWQPPAAEPDEPAAATGETSATEGEAPPGSPTGRSDDEVVNALRGWAAAWTEQRADDYLAYYAEEFEPPDGLDRAGWVASRRARIARPQWIRVALTLVQVRSTGADRAEVDFVQSYRSERYKDLVKKRMSMVRQDGLWKIAAERAAP